VSDKAALAARTTLTTSRLMLFLGCVRLVLSTISFSSASLGL